MGSKIIIRNRKKSHPLSAFFTRKIITTVLAASLVLAAGTIGTKEFLFHDSKTTRIGFEDIGELSTQAACCTEVNVTEARQELFGLTIPFTQSKYVYSYDVEIKAGIDFGEIEWSIHNSTIEVKLPEVEIFSREIQTDSFKVYHEKESIFKHITLAENNDAMNRLKQTAEENAIANGLLENARNNAEAILTGFFGSVYDPGKYKINFVDK
ncbi:MAG: DUF4230 domain-containing protein [Eubacterium sp.]|jgi:hypothetical protein|nr:DUF4230 domain-containing protein [Eubacterium sp.]